jgi:hypothetical protein
MYLEMVTDVSENLENVVIEFKVEKEWVERNNIDRETIQLLRYEEGWNPLPTDVIGEDENYLYCVASTKGFSLFVVVGSPRIPPAPVLPIPLWLLLVIVPLLVGAIILARARAVGKW